MRIHLLTLITGSLSAISVAVAQDRASGWQAMSLHDLRTPSASDPLQTLVWPDVIRDQNAYVATELKRPLDGQNALLTALSSTYRDASGRTIIVSTALSRQCESGANDKGADVEPSICPVRVATIQDGRLVTLKTVTGCYADHADPDLPVQNRTDGTYSRFDPATGTISLRTSIGGQDVPGCARRFSVR